MLNFGGINIKLDFTILPAPLSNYVYLTKYPVSKVFMLPISISGVMKCFTTSNWPSAFQFDALKKVAYITF